MWRMWTDCGEHRKEVHHPIRWAGQRGQKRGEHFRRTQYWILNAAQRVGPVEWIIESARSPNASRFHGCTA
jgi:hypothetical protein